MIDKQGYEDPVSGFNSTYLHCSRGVLLGACLDKLFEFMV